MEAADIQPKALIRRAPVLIALAACATVAAVPLGERFDLAVAESASIDGEGLDLTFDGVTRDNRCPKDVQCIVAGAATVVLIAASDGERRELTLEPVLDGQRAVLGRHAQQQLGRIHGHHRRDLVRQVVPPGGSASERLDGLEITVARVDPQPVAGRRIEPEDYVVTVVVARPSPAR